MNSPSDVKCEHTDIVKRSGVLREHDSATGGSDANASIPQPVQDAVDHAMRRLGTYLLLGKSPVHGCVLSGEYWLGLR